MADNARRARWVRCSGPILAVILSCSALHGQTPGAPSATQPTADADARTAAALKEAVSTATTDAPAATLMVSNREIVVLRATILLRTPATRTASASQLISSIIGQGMPRIVTARPLAGGQVIMVGQQDAFALVPADLDPFGTETLEEVARATVGPSAVGIRRGDRASNTATPVLGRCPFASRNPGVDCSPPTSDSFSFCARRSREAGGGPSTATVAGGPLGPRVATPGVLPLPGEPGVHQCRAHAALLLVDLRSSSVSVPLDPGAKRFGASYCNGWPSWGATFSAPCPTCFRSW